MSKLVLVTGATGFVGSHVSENLQLVDADLMKEDGWLEACRGIDVVIHVASVFKLGLSEEAVVAPAVTGTRNVMTAAADAGVRRVIVTSSIAAIYGGHPLTTTTFTEDMFSVPEKSPNYEKAKVLAEKEAWAIAGSRDIELLTVNPGYCIGPILHASQGTCESSFMLKQLLEHSIPLVPDVVFPGVDVRDVAEIHARLIEYTHPSLLEFHKNPSLGRFIATGDKGKSYLQMSQLLQANFGSLGFRTPSRVCPTWLMKFLGLFNSQMADAAKISGLRCYAPNTKTAGALGIEFKDTSNAIVAHAQSLLDFGIVLPKYVH
ncbi:MAG: uncharacterized protein KVP18_003963 [Porospora cf. gigantea A]|uniref:uncharacterized protein n=2 Tax=Porospora cf. gigantea A TaxID=2853593 RepID=UPI00355AB6AB|nr:MAG: hypothetical protein KVP18_003963 [Porospora cf. gigantea A]